MKNKGVTPVVAIVLLMAMAVAATTTAYQVMNNAQSDVQDSFEDSLSAEERERRTDLNIEVIYQGDNGNAFMTVRNTGSEKQIIQEDDGQKYWTLLVDGAPADGTGTSWGYIGSQSGEVTLSPGSTINIDSNVDFPDPDEGKQFELVGRYESSDTYFCENTGSGSC